MLLQTIVENAIKYGIDQRAGGCEVAIIAHREEGQMRIRVTNPGSLRKSPNPAPESTRLGLRNASARLDLLFNSLAKLHLSDDGHGLITAEVSLPAVPALQTSP